MISYRKGKYIIELAGECKQRDCEKRRRRGKHVLCETLRQKDVYGRNSGVIFVLRQGL